MVRIRATTGRRRSEIAEDLKSDQNWRKKQSSRQTNAREPDWRYTPFISSGRARNIFGKDPNRSRRSHQLVSRRIREVKNFNVVVN